MDLSNFPDTVFRVVAQPGKEGDGIKVRITKIPARVTAKSVITLSKRRLSPDKFGKVEPWAEGVGILIMTAWVRSEDQLEAMVQTMHTKIQTNLNRRLTGIKQQLEGTVGVPTVELVEYVD